MSGWLLLYGAYYTGRLRLARYLVCSWRDHRRKYAAGGCIRCGKLL